MRIRTVALSGFPPSVGKLALVADLHNKVPNGLLEVLEEEKPDAVLVTGDVVHSREKYENGLAFLRDCASRFFTCCSLGNHEFKYGADFREEIQNSGAVLLDNAYIRFGELVIGGLTTGFAYEKQGTFRPTPTPRLDWLADFSKQEGYKILLSHHPEYFPLLRSYDMDLILSGHAHGGQWRLFGIPVFAPGQGLFPRYTSGLYGGKMFVSRGLTNTVPLPRIGNPTELVFFVGK